MTGLVLLSDAEDGRLLAVLDAAAVTALRTAAAGVLAADTLCRSEASSYAVIGCGVNGAETARMLVAHGVTPLVWDVDEARRRFVAERLGARVAANAAEALACEVVITVTPGADVLYPAGSLEAGQHVSLMGADGPGKAEVAIEELRRAHLFCDDWEQASHGGEFAAAVDAGVIGRDDVTDLGAVLVGDADGRRSAGDITLFDSTGLAIQDLAIAKAAYAKAGELDLQQLEAPSLSLRARSLKAAASQPRRCDCRQARRRRSREGSNRSRSGSRSPRIARATSLPHAKPSTLPWPE